MQTIENTARAMNNVNIFREFLVYPMLAIFLQNVNYDKIKQPC